MHVSFAYLHISTIREPKEALSQSQSVSTVGKTLALVLFALFTRKRVHQFLYETVFLCYPCKRSMQATFINKWQPLTNLLWCRFRTYFLSCFVVVLSSRIGVGMDLIQNICLLIVIYSFSLFNCINNYVCVLYLLNYFRLRSYF